MKRHLNGWLTCKSSGSDFFYLMKLKLCKMTERYRILAIVI